MESRPHTLVLGMMDPEMKAIGALGIEERLNVVWAKKDGELVRYDTMYAADWPEPAPGQLWVECSPADGKEEIDFVDHHQPGDPGFGGPPEKFWTSSSLGQVWARLRPDDNPPESLQIIAAADHCPHAAYIGDCPGIDPGSVIAFSAEQVALGTGKSIKDILQGVYRYIHKFRKFEPTEQHGCLVYRREGNPLTEHEWLLFREAALWHGVAVISPVSPPNSSDVWIKMAGHTTAELVRQFMYNKGLDEETPLDRVYGDPHRGYAGGLKVPQSS